MHVTTTRPRPIGLGFIAAAALSSTLGVLVSTPNTALAANHREAPITALDEKADITDFFAFVSYDDSSKVTFILDVDPLLEPSNGPTYFPFDPEILYVIKIDNNHDAIVDISFEFRFSSEIRLPNVFTVAVGAGDGLFAPDNSPPDLAGNSTVGSLVVPPAITALDGPGSEGLGMRQSYTVTMVEHNRRGRPRHRTELLAGENLFAVPTNAGPRTMPTYADLAAQGIYQLDNSIQVFAGTVEDPFWIDLGAAFDSLNFRPMAFETGVPGVLSDAEDADDLNNYAPDDVSGFNVNAIAIEVPIELITQDGQLHGADEPNATIGAWGTTSRPRLKRFSRTPGETAQVSRDFVQIQRMANPLINELVIGVGDKDKFSMSEPKDDVQFSDYVLDPVLARVLNAIYADALPIPAPPRTDLLPLVQYSPPVAAANTPPGPVADLLRLNTGIPATPAHQRSRLGALTLFDADSNNDDPAGFPNGRRVSDDVVDITSRVVAGVLTGDPQFTGFPHNRIGDGVNANDAEYPETFPYLGLAHSGVESRHVDSMEIGCLGTCP